MLPRPLDSKVHLSNHVEGRIPSTAELGDVAGVLAPQLPEEVGAALLDGEEEQAQEVEQGQARENLRLGFLGLDSLGRESSGIFAGQSSGERAVGGVGGAHIGDEEVREDSAGSVERRGMGLVLLVPVVLHAREHLGRILGSQHQVLLGFLGFVLLGVERSDDVVQLWVAGGVVSELSRPAVINKISNSF